jgi:flagellar hook protein FlgE
MGISGIMRTASSGMEAQSNRLSTVADNIANVSTTGYKRAFTEFSSFIPNQSTTEYNSGNVQTNLRRAVSEQGTFRYTTSTTDLAVNGNGLFLVSDTNGQVFLTRAGSFVPDGDGELINAGGFKLMGYSLVNGQPPVVANGTAGLEVINIDDLALQAVPSTEGSFFANFPADADVITTPNLPSENNATAEFTAKTSLVAYANLGREVTLDIYSAKTADNTWEVTVYDAAEAAPGGGFPYASGPLAGTTTTLTFDPATGALLTGSPITIPVPDGSSLELDLSQSSQLAADYTVIAANVNGNGPSAVDRIDIADDGTLFAVYENGTRVATYQIPLANVPSPDNLQMLPGDIYLPDSDSGDMLIGFAGSGGFGLMESTALEQSTVDLADELATMIEAERNFQVNSKVFQTGADLLDVVVNLKR